MAKGKKFWQFRAAKDDPKVGELLLYGVISDFTWWGDEITPKQFKEDLDALGDVSEIRVFINSGGGDVFAGQAIYTMLKRHKAKVIVYVDGIAASIASVVAMAGEIVTMPRNAMMMIHDPWTWGVGNAKEFRKLADDLEKISETIIAVYQDKTGQDREKIVEMLDAETWMTAEEALELGFVDEIEDAKEIAASLEGKTLTVNGLDVDLTRFKKWPKQAFIRTVTPREPPGEPLVQDPPGMTEPQGAEPPAQEPEKQQPDDIRGLFTYQKRVQVNKNRSGGVRK